MKRKIITTSDGSKTIQIEEWNEQYHSVHGAIQEAYHVFINMGLSLFSNQQVNILEIGFGTGLNALITILESQKKQLTIFYEGVEAFPVLMEEIRQLNYTEQLQAQQELFEQLHSCDWEVPCNLTPNFVLTKRQQRIEEINDKARFDLIYFDAFGARVQPELWTVEVFEKMYFALKGKGILVTYAAKGSVRRALQEAGFEVERLPGPPGKREMLRAQKPAF